VKIDGATEATRGLAKSFEKLAESFATMPEAHGFRGVARRRVRNKAARKARRVNR
jgi:hypothetical protein